MDEDDKLIVEPTSNAFAAEHMNESILDLFETNEEIDGVSLAVCW